MSRPVLLILFALLCVVALVSAGSSSDDSSDEEQPGRCIASSPKNKGEGCTKESDCGNDVDGKYYCQTADSYTGRRRKGGKCIQGSPKNAGKACFNSESDCGNPATPAQLAAGATRYCQATLLAETDTCDDWDPTKKGMIKAGLEGYAACGGKAGTRDCWNDWCEANCGTGDHPACVLDESIPGAIDVHTRCKCDVNGLIQYLQDDEEVSQPATDEWSESTEKLKLTSDDSSDEEQPGRCIASSPKNKGEGCTIESDCGNDVDGKYYCQTAGSYTGRRRKGGKCIQGSPKNAGKACFNSESDCGNPATPAQLAAGATRYCQAT